MFEFGQKINRVSQIVFVSLSHKSITVAYEEDSELKIDSSEFDIAIDIDTLMKSWRKSIKKLLSKVSFDPHLILLINSASLLVKNIDDIEGEEEIYEHIAEQLGISKGYFEMTHIKESSYLVVENRSIEKTLYTFKDYHIQSFHDISVLNSLYFLTQKSELYINVSLDSISVIMNDKIFQKRANTTLFLKYLQNSAKRLNLDLDSAYIHIKKNFANIGSYEELEKSTQNGANDLRYFIDDLVEYIKRTLIYFSNYERFEHIEKIYLDGDILELNFIATMLEERLRLDNISLAHEFLKVSDYKHVTPTIAYRSEGNALKTSTVTLDGLRYSDGKQEYIFVDDGLVAQKKLNKEQKKRVLNFKRVLDIKKSREFNSQDSKKPNKSIWKMNGAELIELAKSKFSSTDDVEERVDSNKDSLDDIKNSDETVKIIFLVFLILTGGVYYLWLYIVDLEKGFNKRVTNYESNIHKVDSAKEKLSGEEIIFVDSGINKILWTEKFITISKSMPDEIWFSSIRLESVEKEIESKKVTSSRVVLEGRCLPSFIGHISTIATYMENLMTSDINFRRDFINVSFGGAESMFDEFNRNLISFQLFCNFRRNVNIQTIEREKDTKDNSIAENIDSIKKNVKKKNKILNNIGKE